jgi:quinol monooxygenase YgiN
MSVVVVATITPLPDRKDDVRAALLTAVPQVHGEPGCELYALHEGPDTFVMIERWQSAEALQVHGRGAALVELGAALDGALASPTDVRVLTALPAGDPAKGALRA